MRIPTFGFDAADEAHHPILMNRAACGIVRWAAYVWSGALSDVLLPGGRDRVRAQRGDGRGACSCRTSGSRSSRWPTARHRISSVVTVGLLPGTDSILRNECVVFSAHMDQARDRWRGWSSQTRSGADDNASVWPDSSHLQRRSISRWRAGFNAFSARRTTSVSGQLQRRRVAEWRVDRFSMCRQPLDVSLDMISHGPKDSLNIDGLQNWRFRHSRRTGVAAQRSELGLTLVDGETNLDREFDRHLSARRYPRVAVYTAQVTEIVTPLWIFLRRSMRAQRRGRPKLVAASRVPLLMRRAGRGGRRLGVGRDSGFLGP